MFMNKNTINIGVPSKGRLKNDTLNIFKKKKIPYRYFIFNKNDESELGSIFTFFVLEIIEWSFLFLYELTCHYDSKP